MKKHEIITQSISSEHAKIEAKITDSFTNGTIQGYASVFGVRDNVGDIINAGSFDRAIKNQIAARTVPLMIKHMRDGGDSLETVGVITEAREDNIGLLISAELDGTQLSQDLRTKIKSNPMIFGMSIGWLNNGTGFRVLPEGGREWNEINLKEVTVTTMPANESTMGTLNAKNGGIEQLVADLQKENQLLQQRMDAVEGKANESESDTKDAHVTVEVSNDEEIARQKRMLSLLEN